MGLELLLNRTEKILEYNRSRPHTVRQTAIALGIPLDSTHRAFRILRNLGWLVEVGLVWNADSGKRAKEYQSTVVIEKIGE